VVRKVIMPHTRIL